MIAKFTAIAPQLDTPLETHAVTFTISGTYADMHVVT